MLNHFLTHITAPVQVLLIVLALWKAIEIGFWLRKKHKEDKEEVIL